ncbi:hypothetical protein ABBQ38_010401 [Trebouxia sp. C0009 RCD-2024]
MTMLDSTLDVTPTYLQQLRQRDHNVLYTETVRFGKALAEVRRENKVLQTKNAKLEEECETAASLLEQQQDTQDTERKRWEAFAQTMYDEVGKARADKNVLQRDFEQQTLQLQERQQSLFLQVASLQEANVVSSERAETQRQQLEAKAALAAEERDEASRQQSALAAERDATVFKYQVALQSEQRAKSAQEAAEEVAATAQQLAAGAQQECAAAQVLCRQALEAREAAVKAQQEAELAAKQSEEQARQANAARHDADGCLARSTDELRHVRSELSNIKTQLATANKVVQTATKQTADLQKEVGSLQSQLRAADKAKNDAVEAGNLVNIALEVASVAARDRQGELQAQLLLLEEKVQEVGGHAIAACIPSLNYH